jgi:hypothetical protein
MGIGANNYSWSSVPVGFTSVEQNPLNISPSVSTVYTVSVTNANGCPSTASTSIVVNTPSLPTGTNIATGDLVWTGAISTNYSLPSNWISYTGSNFISCTSSPSSATNVVIPTTGTCVTNNPVIAGTTVSAEDVMILNGGILTLGAAGNLNVSGNWVNNGPSSAFIADATSTVKFNGTSAQTITELNPSIFSNLTIDNTSGVTMLSDLTVANALTLTNGKFIVGGSKTLYIGSASANGTITGGSSSSYIVAYDNGTTIGKLQRAINTAASTTYVFPIGDFSSYTGKLYTC